MAVAGVLLVVVCATTAAGIYNAAGGKTDVIVAATTIQQGDTITRSDLHAVRISRTAAIAAVPASQAQQVVGARAAYTIAAGAIVTPSDLAPVPSVAQGDAIVGLALKSGQLPSHGVSAGQHVMIILTAPSGQAVGTGPTGSGSQPGAGAFSVGPAASGAAIGTSGVAGGPGATGSPASASIGLVTIGSQSSGAGTALVPDVVVVSESLPSDSSSGYAAFVSVEVPEAAAGDVAAAASAGQVSIAIIAPPATGSASFIPSSAPGAPASPPGP